MNIKKYKNIFLIFIIIFILISIIIIYSINVNNSSYDESESENKYVYDFGETLNLEETNGFSDETESLGTDYNGLGIVTDFYDDGNIEYSNDSISMNTSDGRITVSSNWIDKGYAKYITEPDFGSLVKFIYKPNGISARYNDLTMKDVKSYINAMTGLGFNNVVQNEENKKYDYYNYLAQNGNIMLALYYEKKSLEINVYEVYMEENS